MRFFAAGKANKFHPNGMNPERRKAVERKIRRRQLGDWRRRLRA